MSPVTFYAQRCITIPVTTGGEFMGWWLGCTCDMSFVHIKWRRLEKGINNSRNWSTQTLNLKPLRVFWKGHQWMSLAPPDLFIVIVLCCSVYKYILQRVVACSAIVNDFRIELSFCEMFRWFSCKLSVRPRQFWVHVLLDSGLLILLSSRVGIFLSSVIGEQTTEELFNYCFNW